MYAAAGGASLASRQARQRQRQQKKTQQLQAKLHPPKPPSLVAAEHGASTPTRSQSRQFHQLPSNYLRAPQAQGRKLSASYTGQSKLQLLPIDEGDTQSIMQMRMHSHAHAHHAAAIAAQFAHHSHNHQHGANTPFHTGAYHYVGHGRVSPKLVHRHSGSSGTSFHHSHLPKSATATLPLVSQVEATPPTTPSAAAVGVKASAAGSIEPALMDATADEQQSGRIQIQIPHDSIIVTPATPMASPGHVAKQQQRDELTDAAAETQPLTATAYDDDEAMQPPTGPLERKCSVYRMRRSDAFEEDGETAGAELTPTAGVVSGFLAKKQLRDLQFQQQYEPLILDEPMMFKGLPNGRKWQPCAYCEEGICVCEHIECAQGRAAWLERGRRCSVQDSSQQAGAAAHRRWVKRNRIQDASLGGSSDDEDFLGVLRGPSTFANAFLYVGLGTVALGLVIAFVGTGEKGFKTVELRLIGPSLIGLGLICCILRILFCICPSHCIASKKKTRKKNGNKVDADHTTSLLRGENKRVSIARGPSMQKYPITHKRSNSKMLNEGMEALRQIATTSLFMQNEQKPSMNRVVPIIKEPGNMNEAPLEMKKLETALNICEISDEEAEDPDDFNQVAATTTAPESQSQTNAASGITRTTILNEKPPLLRSGSKLSRQRIALNQQPSSPPAAQPQKSQSLSSSSTVKDSIDGDLLMETSLMVINPTTAAIQNETRPPPPAGSGATSRLDKTPPPASAVPTTATAGAHTGAIPRVTSAPLSYDLPSSTPHCYATPSATSMPTSRSVASTLLSSSITTERETRVRGPLGMPLSALTATSNRYASPSANISAPTTTTVSLLPLPAPPSMTTASSILQAAPCIPGQVMLSDGNGADRERDTLQGDNTTSLSILLPTTTTTTIPSTITASRNMPPSAASAAATTALSSAATASKSLRQPTKHTIATPSMSSLANSSIFKFPAPLSSSSGSSSASSNGRTTGPVTISGIATFAPPPTPPVSKFEPELVLSPAKLASFM